MRDLLKHKKQYLEFDVGGSASFDPIIVASKIARFNFGDGEISDTTNSPIHVYSDTSTYRVKIWLRKLSLINDFKAGGDNIIGVLDMKYLTNLGGNFSVQLCPNLTSIINLNSSQTFTYVQLYSNDLTGTLDLSGLTSLSGQIRLYSNPNLTSITNPTSTKTITIYNSYSCDLTGTLDLSGLTGLGGQIQLYSNPNLTSITNPTSTKTITIYKASNCDLGYINFLTLPNMTDINNSTINVNSNTMTATEVNHILVDLDTISNSGYTGRYIYMIGTNAAPDGTSGGFDGLTAKASLITKGFAVLTN